MDLDTESAELNSSAIGCKVGNDTALYALGVRYKFGTTEGGKEWLSGP